MLKFRYKFLLLTVLLALGVTGMSAAPLSIKARLDSAYILMGRVTDLHLEVVKNRAVTGHFPIFADTDSRGYATICGDTIELSKTFKSDTIDLGSGRMQINYRVPLQAFDSGFYYLPPIKYVAGNDTAVSNRVSLKVLPVAAKATDEISGFTDVEEPQGRSFWDNMPNWLVEYWWLLLLILAACVGSFIAWRRFKKNGRVLGKKKQQLPPYEEALQALKQLKEKNLWQQGLDSSYFIELTDILRRYLSRRFGIAAPEMTTTQFLEEARHNPKLKDYNAELQRLLELADFVKFAKMQSLPGENEEAFSIVRKFVESTKPAPEEQEAAPREKGTVTGKKIRKKPQPQAAQNKRKPKSRPKGKKKGGHK